MHERQNCPLTARLNKARWAYQASHSPILMAIGRNVCARARLQRRAVTKDHRAAQARLRDSREEYKWACLPLKTAS